MSLPPDFEKIFTQHWDLITREEANRRVSLYCNIIPDLFRPYNIQTHTSSQSNDTIIAIGNDRRNPDVTLKTHVWIPRPYDNNPHQLYVLSHTIQAEFDRSPQDHVQRLEKSFQTNKVPLFHGQIHEFEERPHEMLMLVLKRQGEKQTYLLILKFDSTCNLDERPQTVFTDWKLRFANVKELCMLQSHELQLSSPIRITW